MKIIILGAGRIGSSLAIGLAQENNEITLVDLEERNLRHVGSRVDLRTLCGNGAHPNILQQAGAEDAYMLVALTKSDEVNMIACQVAYSLFNTPQRIARVRAAEYLTQGNLFMTEALPIDVLISPEQIAARNVERLIRRPGALQVLEFADGLAQLAVVRISPGAPAAGRNLLDLQHSLPDVQLHVAAIYRDQQVLKPEPELRLKAHDEIVVLTRTDQLNTVVEKLRAQPGRSRHILIAGGGNVGHGIAAQLESDCHVKVIEHNEYRARYLSEQLARTTVLQGDATDDKLLLDENIRDMDVFCAVTNNEEANILSAMQAKRMGVSTTIALINRPSYIDLIERSIDIAVSPQQATLSELLTHIRRGDVLAVHSLRRGRAEALEAKAHQTAAAIGQPIGQLNLPTSVDIAALVRNGEMILPNTLTTIQPDDHVILFISDKRYLKDVERLFQVSATFF